MWTVRSMSATNINSFVPDTNLLHPHYYMVLIKLTLLHTKLSTTVIYWIAQASNCLFKRNNTKCGSRRIIPYKNVKTILFRQLLYNTLALSSKKSSKCPGKKQTVSLDSNYDKTLDHCIKEHVTTCFA
jgi:hypothetical protein